MHFIHVKSKHDGALPLIVTHGWPGSVIEQLKIIDPLTDPTAHGGTAEDAFDVVIPSMPGYGFSGKPSSPAGTRADRQRLDDADEAPRLRAFVASGGDWGASITDHRRCRQPPELLGIHTQHAGAPCPRTISPALAGGPRRPTCRRRGRTRSTSSFFYKHGLGYAQEMDPAAADALRPRGFAGRARRVDHRPRHLDLPA